MIWWVIGAAVLVAVIVIIAMKMRANRPEELPNLKEFLPALRAETKEEPALRQNLMLKFNHQEDKINAAIEFERGRDPGASTAQLMKAAIERWERDNR